MAACLLEISSSGFDFRGILHVAGNQTISYDDFTRQVARKIGANEQFVKADTSRAWNTGLDTTNTQSILKTRLYNVQDQLAAIFS